LVVSLNPNRTLDESGVSMKLLTHHTSKSYRATKHNILH